MLEFWKDGKKIELRAIYEKGKVGQMVILGERVNWGVNPDPSKKPLSQYTYPSIFTIVEKVEGGRVVSPAGRSFLDKISAEIIKDIPELEKY